MMDSPSRFPKGETGWRRHDARIERLKGVGGAIARVLVLAMRWNV